jgi:hypothetical protein
MLGLSGTKTALRAFCRSMTAENFASNRTVKYSVDEIGRGRIAEDSLPAPDALVPRNENMKVTHSLSRNTRVPGKYSARLQSGMLQAGLEFLAQGTREFVGTLRLS